MNTAAKWAVESGWYVVHTYQQADRQQEENAGGLALNIAAKVPCGDVDQFELDHKLLREFGTAEKLIQCVSINVDDLSNAIGAFGEAFLNQRTTSPKQLDEVDLHISRSLMNIMSSFRSFLDHADTYLTPKFGSPSSELIAWKTLQASEYDERFAYRFLYKLRNYVQHEGMPPLSISFSSSANTENVTMRIDLDRDRLLEARKTFKTRVVADLEEQPPLIPVYELMQDWVGCFQRLANAYLLGRACDAAEAARRILSLRLRVGSSEGFVHLARIDDGDINPERFSLSLRSIPEALARRALLCANGAN